jgi:hypothetical protein
VPPESDPWQLRRFAIASKKLSFLFSLTADVAQLVEQLIRNQQVRGSNPRVGSTYGHINTKGFQVFTCKSFCIL